MVSQHMFRLCCICMHELRSSVCSFGCQYDSWWSLSLLCTRGSHKQYIFSVIVLFGAFNIVVIVFRSVFSSKPWVYIFGNLRAAHTHTNAYIHAIADFKQLTQTRNRMNTAQMTITIEIQCTTTIITFDSATHITSRSMYIIVFVVVSTLFLFLFAALCLSSSFVHLSFPSLYV